MCDTCFFSVVKIWDVVIDWLPIAEEGTATDGQRIWNFSGWCLDCDSYYQNYLNKSVDPTTETPQWYFNNECEDCNVKYGFDKPTHEPTHSPRPTPKPTTAAPTAAYRDHAVDWVIGRGSFETLTARIGDTVISTVKPLSHQHSLFFVRDRGDSI